MCGDYVVLQVKKTEEKREKVVHINMFMTLAKEMCVLKWRVARIFFLSFMTCQKFIGVSYFYWLVNFSIRVFELTSQDFPYGKDCHSLQIVMSHTVT